MDVINQTNSSISSNSGNKTKPHSPDACNNSLDENKMNNNPKAAENHHQLECVLKLDPEDTYLYSWFGPHRSQMLLSIIQNVPFKTAAALLLIISLALRSIFYNTFFLELYRIILHGFIFIPFWTIYILNVNRKAFKRIAFSFDFWVKVLYVMIAALSRSINKYYFVEFDAKYPILSYVATFVYWLDIWIMTVCVCLFDGYVINKKFKVIMPAIGGAYCLIYSIVAQFLSYSEGDQSIVHIYGPIAVSINSFYITATKSLAIFLFKQSVLSYCRADTAVTISVHPNVQWEAKPGITDIKHVHRENNEERIAAVILEQVKSNSVDVVIIDRIPNKVSVSLSASDTTSEL